MRRRFSFIIFFLFSFIFSLALPHFLYAQEITTNNGKRLIMGVKTSTPPKIDGDISDEAWKSAAKAESFWDNQNGIRVADQTTSYILYDEKFIYVAFLCRDSQPDKIYARENVRDYRYANRGGDGGGDNIDEDAVEIIFDCFKSHRFEDLSRFSLNAIGTRSSKLGGGRGGKLEWSGDWEGSAKRVPEGWTAEFRIPWGILNYPSSKQPITLGINFERTQHRTQLGSIWSHIGSSGFLELEGQWMGVQVPQNTFKPKFSILPYILSLSGKEKTQLRTGADIRYTATPELTVVATINPDFATVEGAVQSINFSRSERFVPERRPFFLEGQDYFRAGYFWTMGPYFYPNRIQTFDVGTKVYGKISPKDTDRKSVV